MKPSDFLTELSNDKLTQYKTAAAADASKADKEGDFKKGDKRFSGIVKATKKQFDNDAKKDVAEGLSEPTRKVFFKVIKTQGTGMPSGYRRVKTMRPLEDGGFYIELSTPGYGMDYTRHNYKNFSLKDDQGKPITGHEANNIINGEQGVAEGTEFEDAYDKGYSDGYDGKGYNSPFPVGSDQDDEYEDGYSSGRLDYNKMNQDLDEQGVAEGSLEELANTSLKVKEPKNFVNTNDRKQVTYKVMRFKSGKDTYLINFTVKGAPAFGKKQNWNAVNVSFGVREEQDDWSFGDEINTDLTAKNKNQFLIYSTVINAVRKFITEYNTEIDEIIMQGAGERQAVMYQRFFQSAGKYFPGWHHNGKHSLVRDVPRQTGKKVQEQGVAEGLDTEELANEVYDEFERTYPNLARRADERTVHAAIMDVLNYGGDSNPSALAQDVARAVKQEMQQGVAEGSEWETRHNEFVTVGNRATLEQINKIVKALVGAAQQAGSKRGFLNQLVGKQSNGDLARMAHGAETLVKNIQKNSNAKPGSDERKELGQQLVYAVSLLKRISGEQGVAEEKCPHCNGPMVSEEFINEKKDACYYKVKSRYKVWPSAYASGALVKCRNKGANNWGNGGKKNESSILEGIEQADESLHDWFNKEKWVRMDTKGNIKGPCAKEPGEGKPKCLPQAKAHSLGKKGRASAAARKRREDPNPDRSGKAINVNTKKD